MSENNIKLCNIDTSDRSKAERFLSRIMLLFEDLIKVPLFRCHHCGECLLSHTGFVCSQRCPKRLRNGPCGGTRENGHCEVYPERKCIWYLIYKRSKLLGRLPFLYRIELMHNWKLENSSAWLNVFTKRIDPPKLFIKKLKGKNDITGKN
ncbi:MAG: methylenetetrahydrofolate reductase C-terminal domain-containing protein [bacterium]